MCFYALSSIRLLRQQKKNWKINTKNIRILNCFLSLVDFFFQTYQPHRIDLLNQSINQRSIFDFGQPSDNLKRRIIVWHHSRFDDRIQTALTHTHLVIHIWHSWRNPIKQSLIISIDNSTLVRKYYEEEKNYIFRNLKLKLVSFSTHSV